MQILYQMSIYLEAVAILPQLRLLIKTEDIDNLTGNYVLLLGVYRALYIVNWVYEWVSADSLARELLFQYHWRSASFACADCTQDQTRVLPVPAVLLWFRSLHGGLYFRLQSMEW